jgi:hypothetical protein
MIAMAAMACADTPNVELGALATAAHLAPPIPTDTVLVGNEADLDGVWIAIKTAPAAAVCPDIPGWDEDHLFGPPASQPLGLARFCRYVWAGAAPAPALPADPGIAAASRDQVGVAVQTSLSDAIQGTFRDATLHYAGTVPDLAPAAAGSVGARTRMTVVDTSPTAGVSGDPETVIATSDHGYNLLNIATALSCDSDGDCAFDLQSRLGMQLVENPSGELVPDLVNGGTHGSSSFLATAIREEVEAWEADATGHGLVLNLSLGWLPRWGGGGPKTSVGTWPVAVQAVHAAVLDAQCRGALVFAAAGNDTGGPSDRLGALVPARWDTHDVAASECVTAMGGTLADYADVDGTKLLHAVGGVDRHGADIANARKNGRPSLVAYSSRAAVLDHAGTDTTPVTGTSVGSLVAATAAAAIWEIDPTMTPDDVVGELRTSGVAIGGISCPLCPGGGCGPSVQVDVCSAVAAVCGSSCSEVVGSLACSGTAPVFEAQSGPMADWYAAPQTGQVTEVLAYGPGSHAVCTFGNTELWATTPTMPDQPCPQDQYYLAGATPYANPQPTHTFCPTCFFHRDFGTLVLEEDRKWSEATSVTITVWLTTGAKQAFTALQADLPDTNSATWALPSAVAADFDYAEITADYGADGIYSTTIEVAE